MKDTRKNYPRVKEWRKSNPDKLRSAAYRAILRKQDIMREAKSKPCADCGIQYPYYVMQFDHCRGEKRFQLGGGGVNSWGKQSILDEVAKCDVVCANCHAMRSYAKKHWLTRDVQNRTTNTRIRSDNADEQSGARSLVAPRSSECQAPDN